MNPTGSTREFPCDGCGAQLEFHIGQQNLTCPYCGFEKALSFPQGASIEEQDLQATLTRLAARRQPTAPLTELEVTCQSCGAHASFSGQASMAECAFCGAMLHRKDAHQSPERLPVDAIVPFQITPEHARDLLHAWVRGLWFAPNEFTRRGVTGKFNGVYLPFWTFDAMTVCRYTGERGDDYTVVVGNGKSRRTETRTRWSARAGTLERFFDDVVVPATQAFDHAQLGHLEPWPLDKAVVFTSEVLAGKQSLAYDVELQTGLQHAQASMRSALEAGAREQIGGDRQRIHHLDIRFAALTYKHTLFPVWLLAYRYRQKSYQVMLNALTGEVQGDRPWSVWKLGAFALALVGLIAWLMTQSQ